MKHRPSLQAEAIHEMTTAFRQLESTIAPPVKVSHRDSFVYRYANKGIHEAIVQKMARYISGLNAVGVLLTSGYTQEVGVLFRTLDEICEDILFLTTAVGDDGNYSENHTKYLNSFYAESISSCPDGSLDVAKPNLIPRKKVRAHIANSLPKGVNIFTGLQASEVVSTAYSGSVHAASENIMEMYGGNPPCFHIEGMRGTPLIASWTRESENYVYRGLIAVGAAAKAFGHGTLVDAMYKFLAVYEPTNGHKAVRNN